jgi:hypothetical protein
VYYSNLQNGVLSQASAALFKPHTPCTEIILYSNLEKPRMPNLILLESQISLAALIQVCRPHTYAKWTFMGVAHCTSYWKNYVLKMSLRTPRFKTPINLTVNRCPAQGRAFECFNSSHIPCCYPKFVHLQPRNVSPWAHSGFEPESPVHYKPWNWNAGNTIFTILWLYSKTHWKMHLFCKQTCTCKTVIKCPSPIYVLLITI